MLLQSPPIPQALALKHRFWSIWPIRHAISGIRNVEHMTRDTSHSWWKTIDRIYRFYDSQTRCFMKTHCKPWLHQVLIPFKPFRSFYVVLYLWQNRHSNNRGTFDGIFRNHPLVHWLCFVAIEELSNHLQIRPRKMPKSIQGIEVIKLFIIIDLRS